MSWILRTLMPRTYRRVQCQHLGSRRLSGEERQHLRAQALCSECGALQDEVPETIHTLAGKRKR